MDRTQAVNYIRERFRQNGLDLETEQAEKYYAYYLLLTEENRKVNLTAITDFEAVVEKHFLDSCSLALCTDVSRETISGRMIDVGSGAGFPGLPLKILLPSIRLTIVESLQKRVRFLEKVRDELTLCNIEIVCARAEDAAQNRKYREQFDCGVSRAVSKLSTLSEYVLPFIHNGGWFFAYKGADIEDEATAAKKAITVCGGELKGISTPEWRDIGLDHRILRIRKIDHTPAKYPRRAGIPEKKPIS